MMRRDLASLTKQIKDLPGFRYITLLTHGGSLTEAKVKELVAAGVSQINISMNYPDARQDEERKYHHQRPVAHRPAQARAIGIQRRVQHPVEFAVQPAMFLVMLRT